MDFLNLHLEVAILFIARLYLGLVFLLSALGKITNMRDFLRGVVKYRILPERVAKVFGFILPWVELGVAFALIIGMALPVAGVLASLLLICFIVAVNLNLRYEREVKCNCYGIAGTKTISWGTIVRNFLLLLLAVTVIGLGLFHHDTEPNSYQALWLSLTISPVSVVLFFFLLAFCFVTVNMLEWTADIYYRLSHQQRSRLIGS